MVDITLCKNENCKSKDECHRYVTRSDSEMQSYLTKKGEMDKCDLHWPIFTKRRKTMFGVNVKYKERDHKFTCGTEGTVADTIDIQVKFTSDIQTHTDFYTGLERSIKNHIQKEVDDYFDCAHLQSVHATE